MGTWGYGLFENDYAMDLKEEIESYLDSRAPLTHIISELRKIYLMKNIDEIESFQFWIVVGYTFWQKGYISKATTKKAIDSIEAYTKRLDSTFDGYQTMVDELNMIKEKLTTKTLGVKRKRLSYICPWNIGDVYALPIKDDPYGEHPLIGEYFILHKVGEYDKYKGNVYPIVEIKVTQNGRLPETIDDIEKLPYVIVLREKSTEYSHNNTSILNQLKPYDQNAKHSYFIDESGFLRFYQFKIYGNSIDEIPTDVIFIGNMKHIKPPVDANYYLPEFESISMCYWKDLENLLCFKTHFYNMQEHDISFLDKKIQLK